MRVPPGAASGFAGRCAHVAATVALEQGRRPLPLGPSVRYAAILSRTMEQLSGRRGSAHQQLRIAATPDGQAVAAHDARQAFADAAQALRRTTASPADAEVHRKLLRALDAGTRAYAAVAAAAAAGDSARFAVAGDHVRATAQGVRTALGELRGLGYDVPG